MFTSLFNNYIPFIFQRSLTLIDNFSVMSANAENV